MRRMTAPVALPTELMLPLGILSLAFGVGGLVGVLFAQSIQGVGGAVLSQYLTTYFQLAAEGTVPSGLAILFWEQARLPLCAMALGFSALGLVGYPILFGVRGFSLSYSVACLWRIFGSNGLVAAGFLFGLTALITVPALFALGVRGMGRSFALLRRRVGGRSTSSSLGDGYSLCCGGCALAVGVAVAVEWGVVPILLASVAPLLV